ncbi:Protein rad9 [Neolecta irregularis DAH-3]|uniref:Sister chromatid cohesion protein n=1 Tax=Neolecta irregularis (strain DAH-3) TaxID=1198029 RepID=A0A1U7LSZ5_NEOID|nr:Protein rad9 [Neolecta irregularis DAH-3]|eukprot:OLL25749.1 Protein rad9 [Neolecta irregularis DAH-3]
MSTSDNKPDLSGSNHRLNSNDIDSALLYTSLTTAVPTGPILDIISQPVLQPVYSTTLSLSESENTWIKENFTNLYSCEPVSQHQHSFREHFQQLAADINALDLGFLQFKDQTSFGGLERNSSSQEELKVVAQARKKLGKFASSILDQMNLNFRYPTPMTPSSRTGTAAQFSFLNTDHSADHDILFQSSPPAYKPEAIIANKIDASHVSHLIEPQITMHKTPNPSTSAIKSGKESRERLRVTELLTKNIVNSTKLVKDDKIRGEYAVKEFQSLCEDIFEADDAHVPGEPLSESNDAQILWSLGTHLNGEPCLSFEIMVRLEKLITNVIKLKRSKDLLISDLFRIQKICKRSISLISEEDLGGIDFEQQSGVDELLKRIDLNEKSLMASSLILLIAQSYHREKQLCSEELLLNIADNVKSLVENNLHTMINGDIKENKSAYFRAALTHKRYLGSLLQRVIHVMSSFGNLIEQFLSENIITRLEFLSVGLIFVENSPKDVSSIFTPVMVESLRVISMDLICKIFSRYEDQRDFITEEILGNLTKLPSSRQKARQFILNNGKHVQLISALLLRLVQSFSQTVAVDKSFLAETYSGYLINGSPDQGREFSSKDLTHVHKHIARKASIASENATHITHRIVNWIVTKAFREPKTSTLENPQKVFFEILVNDFLIMFTSSDWPAAELMLGVIIKHLASHLADDRNHANTRGSALDSLANIMSNVRSITIESQAELVEKNLGFQTHVPISEMTKEIDVDQWDYIMGGYEVILQDSSNATFPDARIKDGFQFLIVRLLNDVLQARENIDDTNTSSPIFQRANKAIHTLGNIIVASTYKSIHTFTESTSPQSLRSAYHTVLSTSTTCRSFDTIIQRLIQLLDAPQIVLRTKALKALGHISLSDPSVLSRTSIKTAVAHRMSDTSPQVRDSALDLVGKYVQMQPALAKGYFQYIAERLTDPGLNVRKRAMRLLKELYIRGDQEIKIEIALRLIPCISDSEEGTREFASKTMDELWFESDTTMPVVANKKQFYHKAAVIIKSISKLGRFSPLVYDLVRPKNKPENLGILKSFVHAIYELLLQSQSANDNIEDKIECLSAIAVFVRVAPLAIDCSHLVSLQVELESKDQTVLYLVLTIYRSTLPSLANIPKSFLINIQKTLLGKMTTFFTRVLKEAVPVICAVSEKTNEMQRITATILSCLNGISVAKNLAINNEIVSYSRNLALLLVLLGLFGQNCDLDRAELDLGKLVDNTKFESVNDYITDTISLFCNYCCHEDIQKSAIQGLCFLCSTNSSLFLKSSVLKSMDRVFSSDNQKHKITLLKGLHEYLLLEEQRMMIAAENEKFSQQVNAATLNRENRINQDSGVATSLMQRYLDSILTAAMGQDLQLSFVAVQIIQSIVAQGLANPRNCMGTVIALQTSADARIREINIMLHTELNAKHESLIETCCVSGVRSIFEYQNSMTGDTQGFIDGSIRLSHLTALYKILKTNRISKKKFFNGLVTSLGMDPMSNTITLEDVRYTKFVVEALSCLDFATLEEVLLVIHVLDRHLVTTADSILQSVESMLLEVSSSMLHGAVLYSAIFILKKHLKQMYGLSEQKCRAFDSSKIGISRDAKPAVKQDSSVLLSWDQVPGMRRASREIADYKAFCLLMNEQPSYEEYAVEDAIHSLEGTFLIERSGTEAGDSATEGTTPGSKSGRKRRKTEVIMEDSPTKKRKPLKKT